ncbi:MAG: aminotransferase class I/II-fold pyridoxal phosphate-dependent enzyme [Caldilineaceae bacterium]
MSLWTVRPEDGWQLDLDDLRRMLRPDTHAVVVNLPHNPTGFLPDAAFVHDLAALADRHGFLLFGDEVYRGLEQDAAAHLPALRPDAAGALAGRHVQDVRAGRAAHRLDRHPQPGDLRGHGADEGLHHHLQQRPANTWPNSRCAADTLVARNLAIIHQNLGHLDAFFAEHAARLTWVRPSAGPIAFPAFRHADADAVARRLVEETGVLILPGDQIDPDFGRHFRLGFGRKSLADGLARFGPFLQTI